MNECRVNPDNSRVTSSLTFLLFKLDTLQKKTRQRASQPKPWCNDSGVLNELSLLTLLLFMFVTQLLCVPYITEEVSTLFRGTSLTTTLMDQYMKMVAIPYLQKTIGDVVAKILECKQSCEV